jgi:hypothetical protein
MFTRFATRRILYALTSTAQTEQAVASTAVSFTTQCAAADHSARVLRSTTMLALLPIPVLRHVLRTHRGSLVAALFASSFWAGGPR